MEGKYLRPFPPKTRPLIGQPAQSANQRLVFLAGKSLIICPPCSFLKTVTLGTVSKKGKTLAVFIQSTFVNTDTRFLHFKAVFGQKLFKEAKTVSQQFWCYDNVDFTKRALIRAKILTNFGVFENILKFRGRETHVHIAECCMGQYYFFQ